MSHEDLLCLTCGAVTRLSSIERLSACPQCGNGEHFPVSITKNAVDALTWHALTWHELLWLRCLRQEIVDEEP